jgi:flavodoxin
MRALVIFHSRTGTTRRLAKRIAALLGADIEEIVPVRSATGLRGLVRSLWEAVTGRPAEISPVRSDVSSYDVVLVGTPSSAGGISSPVRAFLEGVRGRLGATAFFSTYGKRAGLRPFLQMANACDADPVALLAMSREDVARGVGVDRIAAFVSAARVVPEHETGAPLAPAQRRAA